MVYSNKNAVANPSFENALTSWQNYTRHAAPGSTNTVDASRSVDGSYSARIDMGQASPIGFIGLYQILPFPQNTLLFNNITDRPDNLDFWFYLEPKYDGIGDFEIRIISLNARELDYVFDPDPQLSYPNQTFPDGRVMVKSILLYGYPAGQWHHFTRNMKEDWQAPAKMPNGSFLPGYGLNESLTWVEFDSNGFQDYLGTTYSETSWVDNVTIYYDSNSPPLQPPSTSPPPLSIGQPVTTVLAGLTVLALLLVLTGLVALKRRKKTQRPENYQSEPLPSGNV